MFGGFFESVAGQDRMNIARVTASGTLDASFRPQADASVMQVVVEPSGSLLVGGYFSSIAGSESGALARLNKEGSRDAGFNPRLYGLVESISRLDAGEIIVAGSWGRSLDENGNIHNVLAGFRADGSVDPRWSASANVPVRSLGRLPDGRFLAGGGFTTISGVARPNLALLSAGPSTSRPGPVRDLTARPLKGGLRLSWLPPRNLGGTTTVTYEYRLANQGWKTTSSTSVTVKSPSGVRATVSVRAVNFAGPGPAVSTSAVPR